MATLIELGAVEGFILDDPIAGVLDNTEYTLGGVIFKDITSALVEAVVTRGKNRDLDKFRAGKASIELRNENRAFDPLYTSSPFAGSIIPRREVRVTVDGARVFTGIIQDWNLDYKPDGQSRAEIAAVDDMSLLARQALTAGTAVPQKTGARVSAVLNMESVAWPVDKRQIDAGSSDFGADVFSGNALDYLQTVAVSSEQGQLFVSKTGDLVFKGRLAATPSSGSFVTFADDGTGIPYTTVRVNYGSELLYNRATVTSPAGTVIANNDRSQTAYGVSEYGVQTALSELDETTSLAAFLVQKYADPEYRFEAVEVNLDQLQTSQRTAILGLELGDILQIKFTPNRVGSQIAQFGQVIRIDNDIRQDRHDMIIGVASLDWNFLVLDDAEFGIIGTNHLAF
jgi:hypothetical protein